MERRPDLAPHPASADDLDGFQVIWAGRPGPIPDDVQRDLDAMSDEIGGLTPDDEGVIGTRFGRRVVVAPVGAPQQAVDVVDVDVSRSVVLTMGGRDPTPSGTLLAKLLAHRTNVLYGFARAPDVEGPSLDVLQQFLPALGGGTAAEVDELGMVALGRSPHEVGGTVEGLMASDDEE